MGNHSSISKHALQNKEKKIVVCKCCRSCICKKNIGEKSSNPVTEKDKKINFEVSNEVIYKKKLNTLESISNVLKVRHKSKKKKTKTIYCNSYILKNKSVHNDIKKPSIPCSDKNSCLKKRLCITNRCFSMPEYEPINLNGIENQQSNNNVQKNVNENENDDHFEVWGFLVALKSAKGPELAAPCPPIAPSPPSKRLSKTNLPVKPACNYSKKSNLLKKRLSLPDHIL